MRLLNRKKRARRSSSKSRGVLRLALGAALAYFFDPDRGRSRRAQLQQRIAGLARRVPRRAGRAGRRVAAEAYGAKQKVTHLGSEQPPESDEVLKAKIESEVFAGDKYSKGKVAVNVEQGVAVLRGELEDDKIAALEQDVRKVTGVVDVTNLVHPPGQPAPNKEAAREASKRRPS